LIPHGFPFRFVDRPRFVGDGVTVRVTGGAWWARGQPLIPILGLEILAQAAIFLLDSGAGPAKAEANGSSLRLGGIREAQLREPLQPGDDLVARAEIEGRFGRSLRVRGVLEREGATVCEASLLLIL
jgi:3-hydroxymyristoyl/3-hydroxydecanoyl-(acyl carrier protein) dehydratase